MEKNCRNCKWFSEGDGMRASCWALPTVVEFADLVRELSESCSLWEPITQ